MKIDLHIHTKTGSDGNLSVEEVFIEKYMLEYIDGIECWHPRHDEKTTEHYTAVARIRSSL